MPHRRAVDCSIGTKNKNHGIILRVFPRDSSLTQRLIVLTLNTMSADTSSPLRWGICSVGNICNDFVGALQDIPSWPTAHEITSVAARELQRAQDFAKRFGIKNAYGSYEELAADPSVEIVYIGVITPCHLEVGKLMLNAGKHVLCEKPLTTNQKETQELVDLAREKQLFLMEAVWMLFNPIFDRIREEIHNGTIGQPKHVTAVFAFPLDVARSVEKPVISSSSLHRIGAYLLHLATFVFEEGPEEVKAVGSITDDGCDTAISIAMKFSQGGHATLACDARCGGANAASVSGTKGLLQIHEPFWCPTKLTTPSETVELPLPESPTPFEYCYPNSAGLRFEADAAAECIRQGLTECSRIPHSQSLLIASIMDGIARQIGVNYGSG